MSLLVKERAPDQQTGSNDMSLNSGNIDRISSLLNRDSRVIVGNREDELRRQQERQRIIDEMLAKEGVV